MKRERWHVDKEFKLMAVNLVFTGKLTREVADELGIRAELWLGDGDENMYSFKRAVFLVIAKSI